MSGKDLPNPKLASPSRFHSPLRYPGGKIKLANYFAMLVRANRLLDGEYAETYAGGAAVALSLLFGEYVSRIHINDIDRGIYSFWMSARDQTNELCRLIRKVPVTVKEWERQRMVQDEPNPDPLKLALSTFYLNRTNRSGIIMGGLIGGRSQNGNWKMDARFNKEELIHRIRRIGWNRSRIEIHNLDGAQFLRSIDATLPERSLFYLDPPYFDKGKLELYRNYYNAEDHAEIAQLVSKLSRPWVVSYDSNSYIRSLYKGFRSKSYGISYSANDRYKGCEIMFFSDRLLIPAIGNPAALRNDSLYGIRMR